MRNLWNAVVNWVAALVAASAGTPHPIVGTDDTGEGLLPRDGR